MDKILMHELVVILSRPHTTLDFRLFLASTCITIEISQGMTFLSNSFPTPVSGPSLIGKYPLIYMDPCQLPHRYIITDKRTLPSSLGFFRIGNPFVHLSYLEWAAAAFIVIDTSIQYSFLQGPYQLFDHHSALWTGEHYQTDVHRAMHVACNVCEEQTVFSIHCYRSWSCFSAVLTKQPRWFFVQRRAKD